MDGEYAAMVIEDLKKKWKDRRDKLKA